MATSLKQDQKDALDKKIDLQNYLLFLIKNYTQIASLITGNATAANQVTQIGQQTASGSTTAEWLEKDFGANNDTAQAVYTSSFGVSIADVLEQIQIQSQTGNSILQYIQDGVFNTSNPAGFKYLVDIAYQTYLEIVNISADISEIANQNSTNIVQAHKIDAGDATTLTASINTWISATANKKIIGTDLCFDQNTALYTAIIYYS